MARRGKRTLGMPLPISGRFLPATLLLVLGLALFIFNNVTQEVRGPQDLVEEEGTLINYSFRKTPEGERDYALWLKEYAERFELHGQDEATFDTAAFKATVKRGDRVRVEYSTRENVLKNGGTRRLYGLSAPAQNKVYFTGKNTLQAEKNGPLTWLMYALLASGIGLYIFQLVKMQREQRQYRKDDY